MEKIRLKLLGLARNISQNNAYTLVLADAQEQMQIPLTVGLAEAQAVAMLMESIFWERPVMFQLLNNFAHELGAKLEEVFLHKVENQQFFTRLLFRTPEREITLDARLSDAVVLAVSNGCPIYTMPAVLKQIGRPLAGTDMPADTSSSVVAEYGPLPLESYDIPDLLHLLDRAVEREEYETAAKIQDIIKKRQQ